MRTFTVAVVALGLALSVTLGVARGFDAVALTILALMTLVGAVAIAVARRSGRRTVSPATCAECGGVISPNAPYCKHCGARRTSPAGPAA